MCTLFVAIAHATAVVDLPTVTDLAPDREAHAHSTNAAAMAQATAETRAELQQAQDSVAHLGSFFSALMTSGARSAEGARSVRNWH